MSDADWYRQRLAGIRQPAPVAPAPPAQVLMPGQLPAHLAPYAMPRPAGADTSPQQALQTQPPSVSVTTFDAATGQPTADDGYMGALVAAAAAGGTRAMQASLSTCPECGGSMFARDVSENGMPLRNPPRPQCSDCGYPIIQSGSPHGVLSSSRAQGPSQPARQLRTGHQVTVIGPGGQPMTYEANVR